VEQVKAMQDLESFVRAHTRRQAHPLLPEIPMRVAEDVVALWAATEASFGGGVRSPPFWAIAWPGGLALARYLTDHPAEVAGRAVLDFGAGSGVAAVAAARAGATRVDVAEIDPLALAACRVNAAENGVDVGVVEADPMLGGPWTVILAGDVCYDAPVAARIIEWLRERARAGVRVLLADGGRAFRPRAGLVERARYAIEVDADVEGCAVRDTGVWALTSAGT
jgi:predicted nicotinamide N-methyase